MDNTLSTVLAIVREAGAILRQGYGRVQRVDFKGAIDLVTEWDERSEAFLIQSLRRYFPDYAIHAEESGPDHRASEYEWLIDPLDGTTNFVHGLPAFAISVALIRRGRPVLGVVADPLRAEYFSAVRGGGAFLNGKPIYVSRTGTLDVSLLATGFPYDIRTNPANNLRHFADFAVRAQAVRRVGSAALDLAWTACGRFDGYWELRLRPWDIAAGGLIVQEAGGRVTDARGGDAWLSGESIVASNGRIHEEMLNVLALSP